MFKKYFLNRIKESSAWIGFFVVLSALFLPAIITVILGIILIMTPDAELHKVIEELSNEINKKMD